MRDDDQFNRQGHSHGYGRWQHEDRWSRYSDDHNRYGERNYDHRPYTDDYDQYDRDRTQRQHNDSRPYSGQNARGRNDYRNDYAGSSRERYNDYRPEGYRGRSAGDYTQSHRDSRSYYDPADFNRDGYRRNPEADNYNPYAQGRGFDERPTSRQRHIDYNYYESYPSYGQGAPYNDHEWGYIDKQEARGRRGVDNEDTYLRRQQRRGAEPSYENPYW